MTHSHPDPFDFHLDRRGALRALLAPALAAVTGSALATDYPSKPIRMLVGFPPAVGPDVVARVLAQRLPRELGGANIIIENRAGAGGLLATKELLSSSPDGYAILLCATPQISIAPHAYNKPPYSVRDLAPIACVTDSELCLAAPPSMPASFDDYLAKMRTTRPFIGTFGAGTLGHLVGESFNEAYGLNATMVHYKTIGDAQVGFFNGDVQAVFSVPTTTATLTGKGGRVYATTGKVRSPQLPNVPTFLEMNKPELVLSNWFGLFARAGTPDAVLDRISLAASTALGSPDGIKSIEAVGYRVQSLQRNEFAAFLREDSAKWERIIAKTGFRFDA